MARFSALFGELKRRNVFRVAVLFLIASWLIVGDHVKIESQIEALNLGDVSIIDADRKMVP